MEEKIKQNTLSLYDMFNELRDQWISYVKEKGEIELAGAPEITMWDGCSERMKKLVCRDDEAFIVDWYGNEYLLSVDAGPNTFLELCDVVFPDELSPEE